MKRWLSWLVPVLVAAAVVGVFVFKDWQASQIANPVTGIITKISEEIIELKTDAGKTVTFVNEAPDVPVEHLREHLNEKQPVSITWHAEGRQRIATQIDDAR